MARADISEEVSVERANLTAHIAARHAPLADASNERGPLLTGCEPGDLACRVDSVRPLLYQLLHIGGRSEKGQPALHVALILGVRV
jgi:hypothetical protein